MKFKNCSYDQFVKSIDGKNIVLFGATSAWKYFASLYPDIDEDIVKHISVVVDNDQSKQTTIFDFGKKQIAILPPDVIKETNNAVILIAVSIAYLDGICSQLIDMNLNSDTECFSLFLMTSNHEKPNNDVVSKYFSDKHEKKIPAKIHSFWFSGDEKPELYKRCIESWHKYCNGFEIIEWNADNYDVTKNRYMHEAFERRKWAFVSDYARLDVLKNEGGIYMDMDVELVASLEPYLYANSFFCRQEDGMLELGSGFGVQREDPLIIRMLESYKDRQLVMPDGEIDMTPQPEYLGKVLRESGIVRNHNSQIVGDRIILSNDYISCYTGSESVSDAIIGIHWHNGGWLDEKQRSLIKRSNESRRRIIEKYFTDI